MRPHQDGFALVSVLWIITFLSILATSLCGSSILNQQTVHDEAELAVAEAVADAAVFIALHRLATNPSKLNWSPDGSSRPVKFGGRVVEVSIDTEGAKVDINRADDAYIIAALRSAGLSKEEADKVLDRLLDWRDEDDLRRNFGAEVADYQTFGAAFLPSNHPFRTVEELSLVSGIVPSALERLKPILTVYSMSHEVDVARVPRLLLEAMPGMTSERLSEILRTRKLDTKSRSLQRSLIGGVDIGLTGRAFTIRARVSLRQHRTFTRVAVVRLTDDVEEPFWIQYWQIYKY